MGFDAAQADDPFTSFRLLANGQRLGGLGTGLATIARIINGYGGIAMGGRE